MQEGRICVDGSMNLSDLAATLDMTPAQISNKTISAAEQYFLQGVLKENGDISEGIGKQGKTYQIYFIAMEGNYVAVMLQYFFR